jgi:hypothetical protein
MAGIELDMDTTNPEALAEMFAKLESGETPEEKPNPTPEPEAKSEPEKNDPAPSSDQQQDGQSTVEPEGIATKDGRHVIPYSVLKSERDRATRAEQVANEMKERLAALEAQAQQGNQGANNGEGARTNQPIPEASDLSTDDLEALKEDFPTVYKAVMASMAKASALEAKLQPVEQSVQEEAEKRARSVTETVQDAIDSVPKLAHIQATNADAYELAKQFDVALRAQPAWADKPLAERFAKVVEMVEGTLGTIDVPGSKPAPQPSAEELRKAAEAKAATAARATRTNVPTSLSEFPVGDPAAQDEREAAEGMSALQLADKFSSMTPDQMDAWFRTL